VKAAAAALFIVEPLAFETPYMPSEGSRNDGLVIGVLLRVELSSCRIPQENGLRAKLILKEPSKPARSSYEPAECRTVQIVRVDFQPTAAVSPDEFPVHHYSLEEV
jgi:hypothetical protein